MRYIEDVQGADTPRTCCADYLIRFIISMILITMVIIVRAVKSSIIIFFYHPFPTFTHFPLSFLKVSNEIHRQGSVMKTKDLNPELSPTTS